MRPEARTAHLRRTGLALVLAIATALLWTSVAHASEKSRSKKLRRALVRIEHRLDLAERESHSIKKSFPDRRVLLEDLGRQLPLMAAQTDPFSSFHVVGSYVRYAELHVEDLAAKARFDDLRSQIAELTELRHERIGELESLVIAAQDENPTSALIVGGSIVTYSADWEAVAQCESSGDWSIDAYFDGGLQFLPSTWIGFGGGELARYAYQATKTEQIAVAERVLAIQGPKAWPNCFKPLPWDGEGR